MSTSRSENLQAAFLDESSRNLAAAAPSTSAHLMAERLALLSEDERKPANILRHNVCSACGTLTVLGWTAKTARQTGSSHRQLRGKKPRKLVQICLVCYRETATDLHTTPQAVKTTQAKSTVAMSSRTELGMSPAASERGEKASSKRRAKTRKEKSGLQALLNQRKQTTTTASSTLDLLDFMKPQTTQLRYSPPSRTKDFHHGHARNFSAVRNSRAESDAI